ncbi:MAG: signal peptidase II [Deltaproteobacteria bacterium]|jgi:signal peptidase II|nr:signal peptidase II [Deltaproteobacteria bacterium]
MNDRAERMKRYWCIGGIALVLAPLDQLTKHLAEGALPLRPARVVIDGFFNLVRVQNRGAAFGFLNNNASDLQFWFFALATVLAVAGVLYLAGTLPLRAYAAFCCLGLILGGALGNFIDRCRLGHVRDFLDFYWGEWHWPAFNVADIGITLGVFGFIALTLAQRSKDKNKCSPAGK